MNSFASVLLEVGLIDMIEVEQCIGISVIRSLLYMHTLFIVIVVATDLAVHHRVTELQIMKFLRRKSIYLSTYWQDIQVVAYCSVEMCNYV